MSTPDTDVGIGRGAQVIGVAVASLAISWICVSLRFYVRLGIQKFFGREDWLTLVSMILFSALVALLLEVVNYGLGRHMKDIPPHDMPTALKLIFVCELLYVATTAMTKVAIGVYYLRLASKRYQTIVILTTMAVAAVFSTIYFFFLVFQCQPVVYLWGYYQGQVGHCISKSTLTNVTYAHAAISAVSDWSFGLLPVFFVWNLKLNPRTKISVILILSLGFFASSATLVRIVYIQRLYATTDYSYEGINIVKWSMVEPAIGIAAAAIATLRPLFTKFLGYRRSSMVYTGNNTNAARSDTALTEGYASGKDSLSSEFREMLGLKRGEVTTVIYAGDTTAQRDKQSGWRSWLLKRPSLGRALTGQSHSSTPDLGGSGGVIDWNAGITKTVIVKREE